MESKGTRTLSCAISFANCRDVQTNLALVGSARTAWNWNNATLATRFADFIREARIGGNEIDSALRLDKLAIGKNKLMEFDGRDCW